MNTNPPLSLVKRQLADIHPYDKNPRKNDAAVDAVAESIRQCGYIAPIIVDEDGVILAGHTRYRALTKLGKTEVECIVREGLDEEQKKKYRLLDNKTNELAEWDMELLAEELDGLDFGDLDLDWGFDDEEEEDCAEVVEKKALVDRFIVPPFSVLDTRQGYWQDRKKAWKDLGIKSEEGRDAECLPSSFAEKYGRAKQSATSIFDPVLCELAYKWFCTDGGRIYDCFAGGSVRGIVAAKLGYEYHGIDLRQEQIDANEANAREIGVEPHWYCDDSLNADKYIADESCDLIFSCPPYADLEVYSDDPRDISNMEYEDFCRVYADIISIACKKLKRDRFAVFVVGDVRDKKGFYRNFVDYTKKCFNDNGLLTYNEAILIDMLGTAMLRASGSFKNRKLVKVHQNVLVFYKGDPKNIKSNFFEIEMDESEVE